MKIRQRIGRWCAAMKEYGRAVMPKSGRGGELQHTAQILAISVCMMAVVLGGYRTAFSPGQRLEHEEARAVFAVDDREGGEPVDPAVQTQELLAGFLMSEAGDKPYLTKLGIGAVVVNRVAHPLFPDTVAGVIEEIVREGGRRTETVSGIWQQKPDAAAKQAATAALCGGDPTNGALYYGESRIRGTADHGSLYGVVFFSAPGE